MTEGSFIIFFSFIVLFELLQVLKDIFTLLLLLFKILVNFSDKKLLLLLDVRNFFKKLFTVFSIENVFYSHVTVEIDKSKKGLNSDRFDRPCVGRLQSFKILATSRPFINYDVHLKSGLFGAIWGFLNSYRRYSNKTKYLDAY